MATDNPLPTTCTPAPGTPACFPVIPVAVVIAVSPRRQAWDLEDTIMNYDTLFSKSLPAPVETHPGLRADTKYVFSVTYADPDCLPAEGLLDALRVAMRTQARDLAKYPPPQGHIGMRELIAQDLKVKRSLETDIGSIFLSSGAGGAIQVILDAFIDPGDVVLVEEFTYLGTLSMLLARRAEVIHIPTNDQGMNTDALESTLREVTAQGKRAKMIYTISVYQNPMGSTLSLERRKHMLEISHRYGVPILENESYADFRIDGDPLPPSIKGLEGMDGQDSVMYVSAYTKLLGCGLRLGYAVVPGEVKDTLSRMRFGGAPSHLASMAVHEYLREHEEEYIVKVGSSLKVKRDALLAALREYFPPGCTWTNPHGGMAVWVCLPQGADTWAALDKAVESDVKFNPGPLFRANRDYPNYLRLTYSYNTPGEIREGIEILAGVLEREGMFSAAR